MWTRPRSKISQEADGKISQDFFLIKCTSEFALFLGGCGGVRTFQCYVFVNDSCAHLASLIPLYCYVSTEKDIIIFLFISTRLPDWITIKFNEATVKLQLCSAPPRWPLCGRKKKKKEKLCCDVSKMRQLSTRLCSLNSNMPVSAVAVKS